MVLGIGISPKKESQLLLLWKASFRTFRLALYFTMPYYLRTCKRRSHPLKKKKKKSLFSFSSISTYQWWAAKTKQETISTKWVTKEKWKHYVPFPFKCYPFTMAKKKKRSFKILTISPKIFNSVKTKEPMQNRSIYTA